MSLNFKPNKDAFKLKCGKGRVKESFRDETDINAIVAKFRLTGIQPHTRNVVARYADVSELPSYPEAFAQVQEAKEMFAALPSKIRSRFGNDPGQLLAFCADKNNYDEAVKIGLIDKPETEKPKIDASRKSTDALKKKIKKPEAKVPLDSPEPEATE